MSYRQNVLTSAYALAADPGVKAELARIRKESGLSVDLPPVIREPKKAKSPKRSAAMKARHARPEFRAKFDAMRQEVLLRNAGKERPAMKAAWSDPEYRARMSAILSEAQKRRWAIRKMKA